MKVKFFDMSKFFDKVSFYNENDIQTLKNLTKKV